jgi:hypothetical protein
MWLLTLFRPPSPDDVFNLTILALTKNPIQHNIPTPVPSCLTNTLVLLKPAVQLVQASRIDPYLYTPRPLHHQHCIKGSYLNAARIPAGNNSFNGDAQNLPKKKMAITTLATRRGCARSFPLSCVPAKMNAPPVASPKRRLN